MREPLSSRLKERLYHGYGPLNSFSAKIDIAYAFSLIDDEIYNDLRAIKDIRNVFAHSKAVLNFNSPELKPHIQKLTGWSAKENPITLFMDRCKACVEDSKNHLSTASLIRAIELYKKPQPSSPDKSDEPHPHRPTLPMKSKERNKPRLDHGRGYFDLGRASLRQITGNSAELSAGVVWFQVHNPPRPDARGAQSACDDRTIDAIPVAGHVARSFIPRECFGPYNRENLQD